jgi:hypothetical protein
MQFGKLKLVSAVQERKSVAVLRRNKLTGKIDLQIAVAKAAANGDVYVAKKQKVVLDSETGVRTAMVTDTRVKQWWWAGSGGKINLAIRYGSRTIELAKGKNAVEVASLEELVAALEAVKSAITAGELDVQIEQASGSLRAAFAKKAQHGKAL